MAKAQLDIPDEWVKAADERDISCREYVERMARAGRRQFGFEYEPVETPAQPKTLKLDDNTTTDIDEQLKQWILTNLSTTDAQDVDDLIDLLDDEIAELADELCDNGKAIYRPSRGGYLKVDNDE
jgi:hypothetical protein